MSPSHPALLGKAPCQPDFIRIHAQAPACQSFHRWLEASVETLGATGTALPDFPLRFLYADPEGEGALAGVMAPSRDQVGREFPLAVLLPLEATAAARHFAGLPFALSGFFQRATALLAEAASLDLPALGGALEALPVPDEGPLSRGSDAVAASLRSATAGDLQASFEGGGEWYGLRTFLMACDPERKGKPAKGEAVSLECPVSEELPPSAWLELAARRIRWRAPPSFIWSDQKLLLTLGTTSASGLVWFCKPSPNAVKLWPLRTTSADAVASAKTALASLGASLGEAAGSLEAVWSALERMP